MSRCSDIGKYALLGSVRRRCSRGEWTGMKPVCFGLNQENDFARQLTFILFNNLIVIVELVLAAFCLFDCLFVWASVIEGSLIGFQ